MAVCTMPGAGARVQETRVDVDAHKKDARGMLDSLKSSRESAAKDKEALCALFKNDVQNTLR